MILLVILTNQFQEEIRFVYIFFNSEIKQGQSLPFNFSQLKGKSISRDHLLTLSMCEVYLGSYMPKVKC